MLIHYLACFIKNTMVVELFSFYEHTDKKIIVSLTNIK